MITKVLLKVRQILLFHLLLCICSYNIYSQGTIKNLLFNSSIDVVRLNFSSAIPQVYYTNTNSGGVLGEGLAHAENSIGEIIFYVNASGVYDKNFSVMPGSTGIYADPSSAEINICPFPNDPNRYYIIYNREVCSELYYSVVDMTSNGGLGDVINLNLMLDNQYFAEGLEIIRIPGSGNFWLIAFECSVGFHRFRIDNTGINPSAMILSHSAPSGFDGRGELDYHLGKIGMAYAWGYSDQAFVADFDPASGNISNGKSLNFPNFADGIYGLEFSPDATKVFFTNWYANFEDNLFQYEFASASFINQWLIENNGSNSPCFGSANGLGQIELGPNGSLYIPHDEGCAITEIVGANSASPTFQTIPVDNVLSLGASDYIQSDVYQGFIVICSLKDTMTLFPPTLLSNISWVVDTALTDTISTESFLKIQLATGSSMNYIVSGIDTAEYNRTYSIRVSYPFVDLGENTVICEDDSLILEIPGAYMSYLWQDESTSSRFVARTAGIYSLEIRDYNNCPHKDSITLEIKNCDLGTISVPSAFTPNGDGKNDFFTVFGINISKYDIKIYNRWGERVHFSNDLSDLNDLNKGWNGVYGGKTQNSGSYVYHIIAEDKNKNQIEKKGSFVLIR